MHSEIVLKCKNGDRKAQQELYTLYARGMYNVILRMVKNEQDAEDILQNSFVDIFCKLHQFQYASTIGAWIKRIVINNSINHLRKKKLYIEELNDTIHNTVDEVEKYNVEYTIEQIDHAIKKLPDGYRVVLNLYLLEGYDHNEIAQILDISNSTSKSQYSRARKKLKELLSNEMLPRQGVTA